MLHAEELNITGRLAAAGMKGPALSVTAAGDWSQGLQKARLYEQMLLDIILGELAPMSVLDEKTLAARYHGGVSGVREALGRLALEGLVVRRPRVGTVVAPLDIRQIEQAFEVRRLLEARTGALAARNATPEQVAEITTAFDGAEAAIDASDFRSMLTMDRHFHQSVARATGNATLARFIMTLESIATRFWIWEMEKQTKDAQIADVALHRALGAQIAAHDPASAEAAAEKLIGQPPSSYRGRDPSNPADFGRPQKVQP